MKKQSALGLLLISITGLLLALPKKSPQTQLVRISPETTILMFDIDDVVLIKPQGAVKNALWNNMGTLITNPRLAWQLYQLKRRGAAAQEYVHLAEQSGNKQMADAIRTIAYSKTPMPGITEFIHELKAQGFRLDIASNMALEDYQFYAKKYPEIFAHFDTIFVIDYSDKHTMKKPHPEYFKRYLKKSNSPQQRFFFDDKKENVESARTVGIRGLVFKDTEQARKEFYNQCVPTPINVMRAMPQR